MSGRNRVYIGIAALVLIGLALLIGVLLSNTAGVPQFTITQLSTTSVALDASETAAAPTQAPSASPTNTETVAAEMSDTPPPSPTHEPDAGDEPTDTPKAIQPIPSMLPTEAVIGPENATALAQATLLETSSGTGT